MGESRAEGTAIREILKTFEEQNPGVTVEIEHFSTGASGGRGGMEEKLLLAIASDIAPDVVHFERSFVGDWVLTADSFQPLDDVLEPENQMDQFLPGTAGEAVHLGKTWAVPWGTGTRGLVWNVDVLAASGLDAEAGPQTLDELDTFAARMTRTDGDGQFTQLGYVPWAGNFGRAGDIWNHGGQIYDAEGRPSFDHPNNVAAYTWLEEYSTRYPVDVVRDFIAASRNYQGAFAQNRLGMVADASASLNAYRQVNPNLNFKVGHHPHSANGSPGGWMGGWSHVVPKGVEMTEPLKRLINYLASAEVQLRFFELSGSMPTRKDTVAGAIQRADPGLASFIQIADQQHFRPPFWGIVLRELNAAWARVASNESTPEASLAEADRQLTQYLRDAGVVD